MVSLDFSVTNSFRPYHGPGVDSAPSENEYQEHLLAVKAAGAWGWQPHHLHSRMSWKSRSLNLPQTSGPHRTCYGTAVPLCCSYMFRHDCVILRELVVSTLLSYISMSTQLLVIKFKMSRMFMLLWWYDMIYLLTAIVLPPSGISTVHIYVYTQTIYRTTQLTQTKHRTTQLIWEECGPYRLCELYPGICLPTEEKARKNLSQGSWRMPVGTTKTENTEHTNHSV
jgi:hypothetical protein